MLSLLSRYFGTLHRIATLSILLPKTEHIARHKNLALYICRSLYK